MKFEWVDRNKYKTRAQLTRYANKVHIQFYRNTPNEVIIQRINTKLNAEAVKVAELLEKFNPEQI